MSNVLSEEKQQVIVIGQLGWSLRRIEQRTGMRRETASAYLKAAGIALRLVEDSYQTCIVDLEGDYGTLPEPGTTIGT